MNITIRMGAAHYDVTIHEAAKVSTFDLSKMNRGDRATVRRVIIGALTRTGFLSDQGGRFALRKGEPSRHSRRHRNNERRRSR